MTGAAGFAGSHFVRHVLERTDWEVVAPISGRHHGDLGRLADLLHDRRFQPLVHDLRWPITELRAEQIGQVDYVVHFAAESHVERSIAEPVPFVQNNVDVTLHALEFARRLPELRAFVQVSTDEVYGPAEPRQLHAEWSPIRPSNPYSASKAAQEALAHAWWRTYGVPVVITNTMNLFGEGQHPEKFVPYVVENVLAGREFGIHGKDGVFSSRCWTYVRNHADALLFLLRRAPAPPWPAASEPLRVNVVGARELDSRQMVERIAEVVGRRASWHPVDWHTTRPGHDLRYALDGHKLARLGWSPPWSFEEGLRQTVEWAAERQRVPVS